MIIDIPGSGRLEINNILLDYNGTMAVDGKILPGVKDILSELAASFRIYVVTADTFGTAEEELSGTGCTLIILENENQSEAKLNHLIQIGKDTTAAIGNGRNDRLMLLESALGIAVIQKEGTFSGSAAAADILIPGIVDALELFRNEKRIIATLRE